MPPKGNGKGRWRPELNAKGPQRRRVGRATSESESESETEADRVELGQAVERFNDIERRSNKKARTDKLEELHTKCADNEDRWQQIREYATGDRTAQELEDYYNTLVRDTAAAADKGKAKAKAAGKGNAKSKKKKKKKEFEMGTYGMEQIRNAAKGCGPTRKGLGIEEIKDLLILNGCPSAEAKQLNRRACQEKLTTLLPTMDDEDFDDASVTDATAAQCNELIVLLRACSNVNEGVYLLAKAIHKLFWTTPNLQKVATAIANKSLIDKMKKPGRTWNWCARAVCKALRLPNPRISHESVDGSAEIALRAMVFVTNPNHVCDPVCYAAIGQPNRQAGAFDALETPNLMSFAKSDEQKKFEYDNNEQTRITKYNQDCDEDIDCVEMPDNEKKFPTRKKSYLKPSWVATKVKEVNRDIEKKNESRFEGILARRRISTEGCTLTELCGKLFDWANTPYTKDPSLTRGGGAAAASAATHTEETNRGIDVMPLKYQFGVPTSYVVRTSYDIGSSQDCAKWRTNMGNTIRNVFDKLATASVDVTVPLRFFVRDLMPVRPAYDVRSRADMEFIVDTCLNEVLNLTAHKRALVLRHGIQFAGTPDQGGFFENALITTLIQGKTENVQHLGVQAVFGLNYTHRRILCNDRIDKGRMLKVTFRDYGEDDCLTNALNAASDTHLQRRIAKLAHAILKSKSPTDAKLTQTYADICKVNKHVDWCNAHPTQPRPDARHRLDMCTFLVQCYSSHHCMDDTTVKLLSLADFIGYRQSTADIKKKLFGDWLCVDDPVNYNSRFYYVVASEFDTTRKLYIATVSIPFDANYIDGVLAARVYAEPVDVDVLSSLDYRTCVATWREQYAVQSRAAAVIQLCATDVKRRAADTTNIYNYNRQNEMDDLTVWMCKINDQLEAVVCKGNPNVLIQASPYSDGDQTQDAVLNASIAAQYKAVNEIICKWPTGCSDLDQKCKNLLKESTLVCYTVVPLAVVLGASLLVYHLPAFKYFDFMSVALQNLGHLFVDNVRDVPDLHAAVNTAASSLDQQFPLEPFGMRAASSLSRGASIVSTTAVAAVTIFGSGGSAADTVLGVASTSLLLTTYFQELGTSHRSLDTVFATESIATLGQLLYSGLGFLNPMSVCTLPHGSARRTIPRGNQQPWSLPWSLFCDARLAILVARTIGVVLGYIAKKRTGSVTRFVDSVYNRAMAFIHCKKIFIHSHLERAMLKARFLNEYVLKQKLEAHFNLHWHDNTILQAELQDQVDANIITVSKALRILQIQKGRSNDNWRVIERGVHVAGVLCFTETLGGFGGLEETADRLVECALFESHRMDKCRMRTDPKDLPHEYQDHITDGLLVNYGFRRSGSAKQCNVCRKLNDATEKLNVTATGNFAAITAHTRKSLLIVRFDSERSLECHNHGTMFVPTLTFHAVPRQQAVAAAADVVLATRKGFVPLTFVGSAHPTYVSGCWNNVTKKKGSMIRTLVKRIYGDNDHDLRNASKRTVSNPGNPAKPIACVTGQAYQTLGRIREMYTAKNLIQPRIAVIVPGTLLRSQGYSLFGIGVSYTLACGSEIVDIDLRRMNTYAAPVDCVLMISSAFAHAVHALDRMIVSKIENASFAHRLLCEAASLCDKQRSYVDLLTFATANLRGQPIVWIKTVKGRIAKLKADIASDHLSADACSTAVVFDVLCCELSGQIWPGVSASLRKCLNNNNADIRTDKLYDNETEKVYECTLVEMALPTCSEVEVLSNPTLATGLEPVSCATVCTNSSVQTVPSYCTQLCKTFADQAMSCDVFLYNVDTALDRAMISAREQQCDVVILPSLEYWLYANCLSETQHWNDGTQCNGQHVTKQFINQVYLKARKYNNLQIVFTDSWAPESNDPPFSLFNMSNATPGDLETTIDFIPAANPYAVLNETRVRIVAASDMRYRILTENLPLCMTYEQPVVGAATPKVIKDIEWKRSHNVLCAKLHEDENTRDVVAQMRETSEKFGNPENVGDVVYTCQGSGDVCTIVVILEPYSSDDDVPEGLLLGTINSEVEMNALKECIDWNETHEMDYITARMKSPQ